MEPQTDPLRHRSQKWNTASAAAATIYRKQDLSETKLKCNFMLFFLFFSFTVLKRLRHKLNDKINQIKDYLVCSISYPETLSVTLCDPKL